jgi:cytochrome c7-like protein/class III cytochrome C family protein
VCLAVLAGSAGCRLFEPAPSTSAPAVPALPGQSTGVFTTARPTFGVALDDFLNRRPEAVQPIEFPHNIHVGKEIACDVCHEGVATGPVAGLPSVRTCMICHAVIATDRPRIQQITAMSEKGIDLAWQRVYGFSNDDHVRFNHAPHIRAKVECATCHGNVGEQTVAQRSVDHTMGFCVNCHNERKASVGCLTCHF